jgi:hypothetical protein
LDIGSSANERHDHHRAVSVAAPDQTFVCILSSKPASLRCQIRDMLLSTQKTVTDKGKLYEKQCETFTSFMPLWISTTPGTTDRRTQYRTTL